MHPFNFCYLLVAKSKKKVEVESLCCVSAKHQDTETQAVDETDPSSSNDCIAPYDSSSSSNVEDKQPSPKKLKPGCKSSTAVCYICQLTSLPGKFFPKKAIELGVPKGPLFGELCSGNTVTLADGRQVGFSYLFIFGMIQLKVLLRMVPTIVAAHTFCASRDTRVSCG